MTDLDDDSVFRRGEQLRNDGETERIIASAFKTHSVALAQGRHDLARKALAIVDRIVDADEHHDQTHAELITARAKLAAARHALTEAERIAKAP